MLATQYLYSRGVIMLKYLDWQMMLFVGTSLVHDYWVYWRLPRIYYYSVMEESAKEVNNKIDDQQAV